MPITPSQAKGKKKTTIPKEVFDAFDECIVEYLSHGRASIPQKKVIEKIVKKGIKRSDIFKKGYLNVEEVYELAGWKVKYDAPGYNESYPATFIFTEIKT